MRFPSHSPSTYRLVCLFIALLALPLGAQDLTEPSKEGEGGKEGYGLPTVALDMLVFDSREHFAATMSELLTMQLLEEETGGREGDPREAPVFQDFATSIGFESLLMSIEADEAALDALDTIGAPLFVDDFDPDDHHIADPYFRGMVNPQSEMRIGDTIYHFEPNGHYEIDAKDLDALDRVRRGETKDDDGTTFVEASPRSDCCKGSYSKKEFFTYADGKRRLKTKQWVKSYIGLYGSIGAKTVNQRRKSAFGIRWWGKERADVIGVRGSVMITDKFCAFEDPQDFQKVRTNDAKVTKLADFTINHGSHKLHAKDFFDTTHWAEDSGDSIMETLSMCDCREATVSFTLPSTSEDSSNIPLDGSASENEAAFFIEIYRTSGFGTDNVVGGYWSSWFGGEVGAINLATLYNFTDFGGGTVYRVKLAVQNGCTNWDEQVRWIRVRDSMMGVRYRAHVKSKGWLGWVLNGATAGTTGQSRRMEAARIELINPPAGASICYQAHVKGNGWLSSVCDGETAGTTGQSRRMEAIRIWLNGVPAGCNVEYRAHVKGNGWLEWQQNGAIAGTTGESRRMEALQVQLVGCP